MASLMFGSLWAYYVTYSRKKPWNMCWLLLMKCFQVRDKLLYMIINWILQYQLAEFFFPIPWQQTPKELDCFTMSCSPMTIFMSLSWGKDSDPATFASIVMRMSTKIEPVTCWFKCCYGSSSFTFALTTAVIFSSYVKVFSLACKWAGLLTLMKQHCHV